MKTKKITQPEITNKEVSMRELETKNSGEKYAICLGCDKYSKKNGICTIADCKDCNGDIITMVLSKDIKCPAEKW